MQIKRYNSAPALQIWALFLCNYSAISPHIRLFHPFSTLVSPLFYSCFAPVSLLFYSCFAPHSPGAVFTALLLGHTFHRSPHRQAFVLLYFSQTVFALYSPIPHFMPLPSLYPRRAFSRLLIPLSLSSSFRPVSTVPVRPVSSFPDHFHPFCARPPCFSFLLAQISHFRIRSTLLFPPSVTCPAAPKRLTAIQLNLSLSPPEPTTTHSFH